MAKKQAKRKSPPRKAAPARRVVHSCSACVPAKCCMYFSTEIDAPENSDDFDDILWMLAHRGIEVYTSKRCWFLLVRNPCRFYRSGRGCSIYDKRPRICREHPPDECEFEDEYDFDRHFRTYEELERYARRALEKTKRKKKKR